ncbi:MAG: NarK/NasA family nitrate transporter [Gammaproteobacteria bacterium]|nr:NarK/NasA family nitrate transporter [Gammaproteobacteria bacterium]MDH5629296.1 NarK/NasA family nitrate transporter [Gammaproteobacteria bacterium]
MEFQEKQARSVLIMATLAFAANFSVWTLYAVMGINIKESLQLSSTDFGLLLASPMLTGALLRFPVGFLCEMYSCRKLFIWQMIIIIPALLFLKWTDSYLGYFLVGLVIGISGVSFTIGIRYVTVWFESRHQGYAMGVFGAGNAGAAITLALVPLIITNWGWESIGIFYAVGMTLMTLLFALVAPEETAYMQKRKKTSLKFHLAPLKELKVWQFGLYYYFVFGSFLALLLWLPQYYMDAYKLDIKTAMLLTLLFVTISSMVRALGGWFADRYGGRTVNWNVFWVCLVCLFFLSYPPTTMIIHGVEKDVELSIYVNVWVFTFLILVIGVAQGFGRASVYKVLQEHYPEHMGSVGGTVATIGAMGGFTLPVIFGVAVDLVGIHSACFMILYGVLAICMAVMYISIKAEQHRKLLQDAIANNFLNK